MSELSNAPEAAPQAPVAAPSETNQVAPGEQEGQPEKSPAEIEVERHKKELARERQRIGTITRHRYEQQARADAAEAKVRELEGKLSQGAGSDPEPVLDNFKTYDDWTRALAKWEAKQLVAKELGGLREMAGRTREQEAHEQQRAAHAQAFNKALSDTEETGKKLYADFEKVITEAPNLGQAVGGLVMRTSKPAEISYYLAKNPHIGLEIANMDPHSAAMAIGRLEAGFAVKTTQAPPPTPEIGNNASVNKRWTPDDVSGSTADWIAKRNKQQKAGKA